jgi:hypothetical protein
MCEGFLLRACEGVRDPNELMKYVQKFVHFSDNANYSYKKLNFVPKRSELAKIEVLNASVARADRCRDMLRAHDILKS